jgi:predicted secreted protein
MRMLIQVCVAVTICLFLVACLSGPGLEVSCDEFYRLRDVQMAIEAPLGRTFTVTLCSNPSTGFSWGEAVISAPGILTEVGREYDARGGEEPPAPGTPGVEIWTLEGLQPGESAVTIEYGQPWEGGSKAEWTFVLTVTVK